MKKGIVNLLSQKVGPNRRGMSHQSNARSHTSENRTRWSWFPFHMGSMVIEETSVSFDKRPTLPLSSGKRSLIYSIPRPAITHRTPWSESGSTREKEGGIGSCCRWLGRRREPRPIQLQKVLLLTSFSFIWYERTAATSLLPFRQSPIYAWVRRFLVVENSPS